MGNIRISHKGRRHVEGGHPWVFASDITLADTGMEPGEVVDVRTEDGKRFLGRGYYNPKSQISLRMLTTKEEPIDADFVARRVRAAVEHRARLGVLPACRLVHAESDLLPALVVDKFNDVLVMQTLSMGMERLKDWAADALMAVPGVRGIYERNDVHVRDLEGLPRNKGWLRGGGETQAVIEENGIRLAIDFENGQKTGYFLDQRENRAAIAPFVKGGRVLDCFCHIGSFALHAARYGAADVTGVDISEEAVNRGTILAQLNKLDSRCRFAAANAFDRLRELQTAGEVFDAIILDPPAFTKSRDTIQSALRGYKDINLRAMKLLRPGGALITCSCSQHMAEAMFLDMLQSAALDAGRQIRIVEKRGQAKDHPYLLAAPETNYLKCIIAQVY